MTQHCAVQIVEYVSERRFKPKHAALEAIYCDKRVKNLPLVVICIAGAARKGKSFLLNFFLSYFVHMEIDSGVPWQLNGSTKLEGFEFLEGMKRTTVGIWAWNHIFVIKQRDGTEIAVSLIDSQGTFDNHTPFEDSSTIFAMTCLFSSVMCFNVFNELQEDKLDTFSTFVEHAKKINDNLGGNGKLFQDLVFLVRDCQFWEYVEDKNGGKKYLDVVLGHNEIPKLQQVRDILNASYERKHGYVFPHPGDKVARTKTSKVSEIDPLFVESAERMVESLCSDLKIRKKTIGSICIHCGEMPQYIESCVQTFDDNKEAYLIKRQHASLLPQHAAAAFRVKNFRLARTFFV